MIKNVIRTYRIFFRAFKLFGFTRSLVHMLFYYLCYIGILFSLIVSTHFAENLWEVFDLMSIYMFAVAVLIIRRSKVVTRTNFAFNFFVFLFVVIIAVASSM